MRKIPKGIKRIIVIPPGIFAVFWVDWVIFSENFKHMSIVKWFKLIIIVGVIFLVSYLLLIFVYWLIYWVIEDFHKDKKPRGAGSGENH